MGEPQIRWALALGVGALAQMVVIAIATLTQGFLGEPATLVSVLVAPAVMMFSGGYWVGRQVSSKFVLHGLLVGVGGLLFYILLALAADAAQGPRQFAAHAMRILGGLSGGWFAARQFGRFRD